MPLKLSGEHLFCKQDEAGSIPVSGPTRARCYGSMAGFHPVCPGSIPGARTTSRCSESDTVCKTVETGLIPVRDSNVSEAQLDEQSASIRRAAGSTPARDAATRCWFESSRPQILLGAPSRGFVV